MNRSDETKQRWKPAGPAIAGALLVLLATATTPALADSEGFFVGLDLHSSHIGAEERSEASPVNSVFVDKDGGGISLSLGYGFTPSFPLRLRMSFAGHETSDPGVEVTYASAVIEAAYLFREGEQTRPYLFGGFGGFNLESKQDFFIYDTPGPGTVFGGGLLYFATPNFSLDFALRLEFINWEQEVAKTGIGGTTFEVETPVDEEGTSGKIFFGASYWF